MNIRVSDIFREKLNNIQSRVPVKFSTNSRSVGFAKMLNQEIAQQQPVSQTQQMAYIEKVVHRAAQKYNLDPNLIKSIIKAESNFEPNALSSKGAQGLMQLMPGTAKALGVNNPWDIAENIEGGVKYFREKLNQFNGNIDLALAAYNAGPNNVLKHGGIPPYPETQNYIKNIHRYLNEYNKE